jgi:hypothetical protein
MSSHITRPAKSSSAEAPVSSGISKRPVSLSVTEYSRHRYTEKKCSGALGWIPIEEYRGWRARPHTLQIPREHHANTFTELMKSAERDILM